MPHLFDEPDEASKMRYLENLVTQTYLSDVVERNDVRLPEEMGTLFDVLCSTKGSLVNPSGLAGTLQAKKHVKIAGDTVLSDDPPPHHHPDGSRPPGWPIIGTAGIDGGKGSRWRRAARRSSRSCTCQQAGARARAPQGAGPVGLRGSRPAAGCDRPQGQGAVPVRESPVFYGWLAALGVGAEALRPKALRDGYAGWLRGILDKYEN